MKMAEPQVPLRAVQVEAQDCFAKALLRARGPWRDRVRQACRAVQLYAPEIREWLAADDVDLRAMMGLAERRPERSLFDA